MEGSLRIFGVPRAAWKRLVLAAAAVCLFGVTYILVLPASATNKDAGYACGMGAHTHGPLCYEKVLSCNGGEGHAHSDACWEQILVCDETEHVHGDACVR